jgi:hypothetical protein
MAVGVASRAALVSLLVLAVAACGDDDHGSWSRAHASRAGGGRP